MNPENPEKPPRSRLAVFGDMLLLALFAVAVGALAYRYLAPAPRTPTQPAPARRDDRPTVDAGKMRALVRETPPGEILPVWTPPKLSARWRYIIVHHSATNGGNGRQFDRWHRQRGMENGMAYHFVITNGQGKENGPDGQVEIGRRWLEQLDGGHVRGDALNHEAIGVCLVGNFLHQMPTPKQIASCKALIKHLRALTGIPASAVISHQKAPRQATVCPGCLPVELLTAE